MLVQNRWLMHDVDGVNAGYARLLLDEYLDNPESVPPEWRALFESGQTDLIHEHTATEADPPGVVSSRLCSIGGD